MKDVVGKTAVVTGAASGIGRAMAERFAREGMRVVLADVEDAPLQAAAVELRSLGGGSESDVIAVRTDVRKLEEIEALRDRAVDAFGKVHVLCNNAGVGAGGLTWETTNDDWEWVLGVNLWGVVHGVRTFLPGMLAHGEEGHVVNTASMAGMVAGPFMGPYNVSKFGVVALSETLAYELQMSGGKIGVSVLCPGFVNTRIHESGRNRPAAESKEQTTDSKGDAPDGAPYDDPADYDPGPGGPQLRSLMAERIAAGMPPAEVASKVFDAMGEGRFYILTHPEMKPAIEGRFGAIMGDGKLGGVGLV